MVQPARAGMPRRTQTGDRHVMRPGLPRQVIQAGPHTITAASPVPDDLRQAINTINASQPAHQN